MQNVNKQKGFTLVEIAIVLVIVGLITGGTLKGQEMIKSAEIRSVITDIRGFSTATHVYRDRYNALPGDDFLADKHTGLADSNGDGNGVIEASESPNFFAHLRAIKLISGNGDVSPDHDLGGQLSVRDDVYNLHGNIICASDIDRADALIIDTKEDDGVMTTGSIQGGRRGDYIAATRRQSTRPVTLCFEL